MRLIVPSLAFWVRLLLRRWHVAWGLLGWLVILLQATPAAPTPRASGGEEGEPRRLNWEQSAAWLENTKQHHRRPDRQHLAQIGPKSACPATIQEFRATAAS